jgi:hypothetical protein
MHSSTSEEASVVSDILDNSTDPVLLILNEALILPASVGLSLKPLL